MLVGRGDELLALRTLLAAARVGDSRVLVLRGEPGIGKSALLDEAAGLAGDMRVIRAAGFESEQLVPFSGLSQVLGPLLPLLDQVPAPRAAALRSALALDEAPGAEPQRFAVGAGTLSLLSRAAEDRPVALLVDDAHLLDSSTVDALVFAVRRLVSDTIAVVACVRPDEPGAEPWLQLPALDVAGLDLEQAAALLGSGPGRLGSRRLARLHRATDGNPLALLELGDQPEQVDDVPAASVLPVSQRLSEAFLGRVRALDTTTRATLLVAAADSGSAATVHAACRELGLEESGLTAAEDAGLVSLRGDEIVFRHPLVRSAVYGAADPDRRRSVHRALAAVLPAHETDRLAWHLSRGAVAPDEDTAAALDAVAARAATRGAHGIGALALERAAGLSVDGSDAARRLAGAGELAWLAGRTDHARGLLERVLAQHPDSPHRPRVREVLGAVEARAGSLDSALRILLEAADEAEATGDADRAVRVLGDAVLVAFYRGDPRAARDAADRIVPLLDAVAEPATRLMGSVATGMALVISGDGEQGTLRLRAAAYELATADDPHSDPIRLPLRIQGALWLRDTGPRRALIAEVLAGLRDHAAIASLPYLLMHIGREAATSDRWDDAEAAYREAVQLTRENGHTTELSVALAGLSIVLARRGRAEDSEALAAEAEGLCRRNHVALGEMWVHFARGDTAAGAGDLEVAATHYGDLESLLERIGFDDPDQSSAAELAETLVHLGRGEDARAVAERLLVLAQGKGQPWSLARAERALALTGDDPQAHFTEALRLHDLTPDRYETARTQLAYGAWLRRERRRAEARPLLRDALATFEDLGAQPWADKAAAELQATGETARRREVSAEQALTPQERQIAQLLAEGRTTREAAAALFISPKTVEYHLRHVYMKLGINTRAALTERLSASNPD